MPQSKTDSPDDILAADYSVPGKCPLEFSQHIADTICERIADGQSLREISEDKDMPSRSVVLKWLTRIPPFAAQYAQARELQADTIFDEILDIADNARNDWMERQSADDLTWTENGEAMRRSALRIETRKWVLGKLRPKKYGDQARMVLSGPQGEDGKPTAVQINIVDPQR